jgi:arylsulfatase A-like enzyme
MAAGALTRVADAALAAALLLLFEALAVAVWAGHELNGAYEIVRVMGSLWPLAVVAALPLSLGGALISAGLTRSDTKDGRLMLTLLTAAFTLPVAVGVSGGRLLTGGLRWPFVTLTVAVAAAACWFGSKPLHSVMEKLRKHGAIYWLALVAALLLLLELVNALVLPRLYPAFHIGLAVLTLWLAALLLESWRERGVRTRMFVGAGLLTVSAIAALGAPARIAHYDNVRFIYSERAPLLSHVVRLAVMLAPPAPVAGNGPAPGADRAGRRAVDFGRRDVLLITIDALRADHVGAYGYERNVTPELDALAAKGAVFEAAYTATPHTSYAVTSLMTGKYMRPLLRQGVAHDSETWAQVLRRYDFRTAAFFPPAAFFVDRERFERFESTALGFEYSKVQFSSAKERAEQLESYLKEQQPGQRQFIWVHLFEPHEPYVAHPEHPFGERSLDRYDSEIAASDAGLGVIARTMLARRPDTVVIVSADHGEEFGDHGGHYHGTTVYDEQVRVPLVVVAKGLIAPRRVPEPVGLVDLMPTVLRGFGIPVSPRVRGRDLGPLLVGEANGEGDASSEGFAFAETDEQTLLAQGNLRLVCARRVGACRLFNVEDDPGQQSDVSAKNVRAFSDMKRMLASFVSSLGRYESGGGGRSWPRALRRGIAGDVEAVRDVAALLDDADVEIRRKAAEVLFALNRKEVARHLRRALRSDEDDDVKRWCALALTRMEQGAPLVFDMLERGELHWQRLAALVLAENGDDRGEHRLLAWWRRAYPRDPDDASETIEFERAQQLAAALARIKSKAAIGPLGYGLRDVRLRIYVARALASIGDEAARPALGKALAEERYHDARVALAQALVQLDGGGELRKPLIRFLGVPDPMPGGLGIALDADVLSLVGGPRKRELRRLREFATSGVSVGMVVPKGADASRSGSGAGLRVIVRARATDGHAGQVRFGLLAGALRTDRKGLVPKQAPTLEPAMTVTLRFEPGEAHQELYATLPEAVSERISPGEHADFVIYATQNVELSACAVVPLAPELPPPAPKPWTPPARD